MVDIAGDRIKKVRRRDSHIYGMEQLKENMKYVMEQYIYNDAEYMVNISSLHRMKILNSYNALIQIKVEKLEDDTTEIVYANVEIMTGAKNVNNEEKQLTKQLLMIFDDAIKEISGLMKTDSLARFYRSKEYKVMIKDAI